MKNPYYFQLSEFLKSDVAAVSGIDNFPTWADVDMMRRFSIEVLDPIREKWGQPLVISSGFRVAELNAIVGGSATSDHMEGLAVDVKLVSWSKRKLSELFNMIYEMVEQGIIDIDQVIYYRRKKIIHIGCGERLRKQFMVKS